MGRVAPVLALVALVACAQGAQIDDILQRGSDDDGDGGARGDGGRRNDGGRSGDGGDPSSGDGGDPGPGPGGPTSSASSGDAATNAASSSASSASSSASSVASSSAAQSSSSSSGGGPVACNAPLDPAQDCGPGQHCFPTDVGVQPTCSDAGNAGQYAACTEADQCAPIYGCVGIVADELPCCLQFCTNDFDCPSLDDYCYPFDPPQYAGGVQYGVCYDGVPAGCG